jgi:hypothetical protein
MCPGGLSARSQGCRLQQDLRALDWVATVLDLFLGGPAPGSTASCQHPIQKVNQHTRHIRRCSMRPAVTYHAWSGLRR